MYGSGLSRMEAGYRVWKRATLVEGLYVELYSQVVTCVYIQVAAPYASVGDNQLDNLPYT